MMRKSQEIIIVSNVNLQYSIFNSNMVKIIYFSDDCTFLIESPPGTKMQLNATISILKTQDNKECNDWLKFYDFYNNTTLVPLGE